MFNQANTIISNTIIKIVILAVILILCYAATVSAQSEMEQRTRLRVVNGSDTTIWIFYLTGAGGGTLPEKHQFKLDPGDYIDYDIPAKGVAGTRFWPGMGCDSSGNNCTIGASGGPPADGFGCPPFIGCAPPLDSKFEGTFGCLSSVSSGDCQVNPSNGEPLPRYDSWDTSMVDGYTLPYEVVVNPIKGPCSKAPKNNKIDCTEISWSDCPTNEDISTNGQFPYLSDEDLVRRHPNKQGIIPADADTVGCYSPCSKLTSGQWQTLPPTIFHPSPSDTTYVPSDPQAAYYCCAGPAGNPSVCREGPGASTQYVKMIHRVCKNVYAYGFDDNVGLFQCPAGTQYTVTFFAPK